MRHFLIVTLKVI